MTALPRHWRCRRCGNCCRVEGYVRVGPEEVERLAAELGLSVSAFTDRYTRLTDDRRGLSLTEKLDGSCVFLDDTNGCRVQDAKPRQCRLFPHGWSFEGVEDICEGCATGGTERQRELTVSPGKVCGSTESRPPKCAEEAILGEGECPHEPRGRFCKGAF